MKRLRKKKNKDQYVILSRLNSHGWIEMFIVHNPTKDTVWTSDLADISISSKKEAEKIFKEFCNRENSYTDTIISLSEAKKALIIETNRHISGEWPK